MPKRGALPVPSVLRQNGVDAGQGVEGARKSDIGQALSQNVDETLYKPRGQDAAGKREDTSGVSYSATRHAHPRSGQARLTMLPA